MISNCSCPSDKKIETYKKASVLSTFLVIIIPKCPFCVMAYSSAITICGGHNMYLVSNNWISYVPLALALLIITLLWLNRRGTRTWYALLGALLGLALILGALQLILSPFYYNIGATLLFLSIWVNGSFMYLTKIFKSYIGKQV